MDIEDPQNNNPYMDNGQPKKRIYKSHHDPKLLPTASTFIISNTNHPKSINMHGSLNKRQDFRPNYSLSYSNVHANFGPPEGVSKGPKNRKRAILRSNRISTLKELKESNPDSLVLLHKKPTLKPALDICRKCNPSQKHTPKNFIKQNYENAFNYSSRSGKIRLHHLENIDFKKKEDYGKLPKYLIKEKKKNITPPKILGNDSQSSSTNQSIQSNEPIIHQEGNKLTHKEKTYLLKELRQRWDLFNAEYQKSAHWPQATTLKKNQRKIYLENKLDQIESLIVKLETIDPI